MKINWERVLTIVSGLGGIFMAVHSAMDDNIYWAMAYSAFAVLLVFKFVDEL